MNPLYAALAQKLLARNLKQDFASAMQTANHMVSGLNQDQQDFVKTEWKSLGEFLNSDGGKTVASEFVDRWMDYRTNPSARITSDV